MQVHHWAIDIKTRAESIRIRQKFCVLSLSELFDIKPTKCIKRMSEFIDDKILSVKKREEGYCDTTKTIGFSVLS